MLPEKDVPSAVVGTVVGDVRITQLDWKRVPLARSCGCKSSVAITTECSRHHASVRQKIPVYIDELYISVSFTIRRK